MATGLPSMGSSLHEGPLRVPSLKGAVLERGPERGPSLDDCPYTSSHRASEDLMEDFF